ncbi:hypothetical protein D9M69_630980 [compost metagenome]
MVAAHAARGGFERVALHSGEAFERGLQFSLRELQLGQRLRVELVEAVRVLQHRFVAALLHVGQDVGHHLLDRRVRVRGPMQPRLEFSVEAG